MNIVFDRANFPMIWVEGLQAHIHWLPVTKIQFEYFLWDATHSSLDQAWVDRVYNLNPRVTPKKIHKGNYWRAFITGVAPVEAEMFAAWCGDSGDHSEYSIPKADEWQTAYKEMQGQACEELNVDTFSRSPDRVKTLLRKIEASLPQRRHRADQMLFERGVLEWVSTPGNDEMNQNYSAYGQTNLGWEGANSGPWLNRLFDVRHVPMSPDDDAGRAAYYGFRLLRRQTT